MKHSKEIKYSLFDFTIFRSLMNFNFPYLSNEWVDYVEEPMKYQALRPHFFSMDGWGGWWGEGGGWVVVWVGVGVLVRDVVGGGERVGGGMGDGVFGGW